MAINLLVFQTYKDALWAQKINTEPMNDIKFVLPSDCFYPSELHSDWKKCIIGYPSDIRLPAIGQIIMCMQFESGVDAGLGYNKSSPVMYKTIKYGKKFACKNPDPAAELTKADFNHDDWETYMSLEAEIVWKFGTTNDNFVIEIISKKIPPIECQKNYETCELYIYKPEKIVIHMNKPTADLIAKMHADGKGFIRLPESLATLSIDQSTPGSQVNE
jgi:hypothetical protein